MGVPSDEVVQIRHPDAAGDPTVVTVSCPDKTGLGCDLCRAVLLFGLSILKGGLFSLLHQPSQNILAKKKRTEETLWILRVADMSTDGRWCYVVLWVVPRRRGRRPMSWDLLKERLVELCPAAAPFGLDSSYLEPDDLAPAAPQVFLLKFCCFDRMGLLHGIVDFSHHIMPLLRIGYIVVNESPDRLT
jgi:hypothetical protein